MGVGWSSRLSMMRRNKMFYEAKTSFGERVIINLDNVNKIEEYNSETHLTFNCSLNAGDECCMYEVILADGEYDKIKKYMHGHNLLRREI